MTQPGETIALMGSIPELGSWDVAQAVPLRTQGDRYPLWWVELELEAGVSDGAVDAANWAGPSVEYKYLRIKPNRQVNWEAWGSNRWVPLEAGPQPSPIVVEDGWFGAIPSHPYGYLAEPAGQRTDPKTDPKTDSKTGPKTGQTPVPDSQTGLKIVVLGSSVALGCSAWMLRGWAWRLGRALQQGYGHQLVNVSQVGANISTTIARFSQAVGPERPDIVIIALSLGNEGFASCAPQHRSAVQRRFENGLQQLIKMTRQIGAYPILGGLYPNGDYSSEHYALLRDSQQRMASWGVPVLDWLADLSDSQGQWQAGLCFDAAHPNSIGHQRMFEAIDLNLFGQTRTELATQQLQPAEKPIYQDDWGFQVCFRQAENSLRLLNPTAHAYGVNSGWQELQAALGQVSLPSGLYLAEAELAKAVSQTATQTATQAVSQTATQAVSTATQTATQTESLSAPALFSLFVQENGAIAESLQIPPGAHLVFHPLFHFFDSQHSQVLFYDGQLGILKVGERRLYIVNESDHEYNIQPMWQEVRAALKTMPPGLYEDLHHPNIPFRTMMIGSDGLESRVKAPAQSALLLEYKCSLAEISRVAIIPLGDRCAVRMLLYKLEYDGPAFPFDLTRTTNLADVADMIQNDFRDMWNPAFLHYSPEAGRIYHTKWTGLSFAHEVEDSDDPVQDMTPVYRRMQTRYGARARRFGYTVQHCDKALFVRTGRSDRGTVVDLVQKLEAKYPGKPFRLLLLSPQSSDEFADLPNVLHYNQEFNPDRMYENLDYWWECTEVMRGILNSLGVSSKNLFWCPPH